MKTRTTNQETDIRHDKQLMVDFGVMSVITTLVVRLVSVLYVEPKGMRER